MEVELPAFSLETQYDGLGRSCFKTLYGPVLLLLLLYLVPWVLYIYYISYILYGIGTRYIFIHLFSLIDPRNLKEGKKIVRSDPPPSQFCKLFIFQFPLFTQGFFMMSCYFYHFSKNIHKDLLHSELVRVLVMAYIKSEFGKINTQDIRKCWIFGQNY